MRIIVGIDPGTGVSSGTGLAAFDSQNKSILIAEEVMAQNRKGKAEHRIKDITTIIEGSLFELEKKNVNAEIAVCIEEFVMRGKGGLVLQRLVGAVISRVPYKHRVIHVQNTRVKSILTGHGHADKKTVAEGVKSWFVGNKASVGIVDNLIKNSKWDILDALAIAIAGYEMEII